MVNVGAFVLRTLEMKARNRAFRAHRGLRTNSQLSLPSLERNETPGRS
jgi:hypothetical protein